MDLVLDANNSAPDFVTVIAAEQCNGATALPAWAGVSCCIRRPSLMGTACLRRKDCCCGKPSSEGAEVSPSAAQEQLSVSGCCHWSSCDPAHLLSGVAGFGSLMDTPTQVCSGCCRCPVGSRGTEAGPAGSRTPFTQECSSMKRAQLCNTNVLTKPQRG